MMSEQNHFKTIIEKAMLSSGREHMRPVIEKEILHYDILYALEKEHLLDALTFQGGTCLRLCYGSSRLSEDLNFTGGFDFNAEKMSLIKDCIETYIGRRYQLEVQVKEPSEFHARDSRHRLKIHTWQISVITAPQRKDIPRQRVKIEIANIESYSREPLFLKLNYDFMPDGYSDLLIFSETREELLADKIVSLINAEGHIRYRDIWDLHWLKQQNIKIDINWVRKKLRDYQQSLGYVERLEKMCENFPQIIHGQIFKRELSRFLPIEALERSLYKEKFLIYLTAQMQELFEEVKRTLLELED